MAAVIVLILSFIFYLIFIFISVGKNQVVQICDEDVISDAEVAGYANLVCEEIVIDDDNVVSENAVIDANVNCKFVESESEFSVRKVVGKAKVFEDVVSGANVVGTENISENYAINDDNNGKPVFVKDNGTDSVVVKDECSWYEDDFDEEEIIPWKPSLSAKHNEDTNLQGKHREIKILGNI